MEHVKAKFNNATVDYYLSWGFSHLKEIVDRATTVLVTDENIYSAHEKRFKDWSTIILQPGEEYKVQETVNTIVQQLIDIEADRKFTLVGVGGGVITDLTGYAASVYMRGIKFGFVPTSLLAMVDASIGGKNGIDVGVYKNLVGTIRQPSFLLYDMVFLNSLPQNEWENGFAEIIKHACIKDAAMFKELEENSLKKYQSKQTLICKLVEQNVMIKTKVVQKDEFESGDRKLLNFGHTLAHALENQYDLSHGQAVSIGMTYASLLSRNLLGFKEPERVLRLIGKYNLPTFADFNPDEVFEVLKMDKKRERKDINYILLEKIGKGVIKKIPLEQVRELFN